MCIEKLVCKEKLLCPTTGTSGTIVFSTAGHAATPLDYIAVLLKTSGPYTVSVVSEAGSVLGTKTKQGTGAFEFCILTNLGLTFPNVYTVVFDAPSSMSIYELNLASICLCSAAECE